MLKGETKKSIQRKKKAAEYIATKGIKKIKEWRQV